MTDRFSESAENISARRQPQVTGNAVIALPTAACIVLSPVPARIPDSIARTLALAAPPE